MRCIGINFTALTWGAEIVTHSSQQHTFKSHISGFSSEETLPTKFRIPYPKMIKKPPIELDKLKFLVNRNHKFFAQWRPQELEKNGYIIIQGSRFLSYKTADFIESYNKGVYDVSSHPSHDFTSQQLILGRFWDDQIGSASLISSSMQHVANSYGYVLSVPAELILNLYPEDAATTMERDLSVSSIEIIQSNIIDRHYVPRPDKLIKNRTKYTNGYFPSPTDFLNDSENGHNEIKFAVKGQSDGKIYAVSVVGFYIKDIDDGSIAPLATSEEKKKIEVLAKELNLPVLYFSKMVKSNVSSQKFGGNEAEKLKTIEPKHASISEKSGSHYQAFKKLESNSHNLHPTPLDSMTVVGHLTSPGVSELLAKNLYRSLVDIGESCPDNQILVTHLTSSETSKLLTDNLHFLPMKKHHFRISPAISLTQQVEKKENGSRCIYSVGDHELFILDIKKHDFRISPTLHLTQQIEKNESGTYKSTYSVGEHEVFIIDGEPTDRQ